jgi:hypothetical protein
VLSHTQNGIGLDDCDGKDMEYYSTNQEFLPFFMIIKTKKQ